MLCPFRVAIGMWGNRPASNRKLNRGKRLGKIATRRHASKNLNRAAPASRPSGRVAQIISSAFNTPETGSIEPSMEKGSRPAQTAQTSQSAPLMREQAGKSVHLGYAAQGS